MEDIAHIGRGSEQPAGIYAMLSKRRAPPRAIRKIGDASFGPPRESANRADRLCRWWHAQPGKAVAMRQLRWALILVCAACSIAAAADTYLGDAIKTPSYSRALTNLLKGSGNLPSWNRQVLSTRGDYVGSTVDYVTVEGTRYELYNACKPHDCGDNALEVMFAPNGAQAWGALKVNGESISYLGAPSPAQQSVLKGALQP
jgi:Inhibitor of vertebrate lysozyme (Ivy)